MAIPSDPTVTQIVTEGLKRGGRVSPSAGDITNATDLYLQEVKSDIYLAAPKHESLRTMGSIPVFVGKSRYNWPTNCDGIESIQYIETTADDGWLDTAQSGGANYITLSSTFDEPAETVQGRMVFIHAGTGAGQFAQIQTYNNTSKVATIDNPWATLDSTWVSPNSTSVYLVEKIRYKLWQYDKQQEFDTITAPFQPMTPTNATLVAREILLNTSPSAKGVLLVTYWIDLAHLDEALSIFVKHLRKFRSIWTQGVAVKTMQRFDEGRYTTESKIYYAMLQAYSGRAAGVGQVQFRDV